MPQVIEAIYYAVDRGFKLPIVYNTSSYDSVKSIELLDGLVGELGGQVYSYLVIGITLMHYTCTYFISDVYLPDFKFWHAATSQRLCKARDYPEVARRIITMMHRQVGYWFLLNFTNDNLSKLFIVSGNEF